MWGAERKGNSFLLCEMYDGHGPWSALCVTACVCQPHAVRSHRRVSRPPRAYTSPAVLKDGDGTRRERGDGASAMHSDFRLIFHFLLFTEHKLQDSA